MDSSDNFRIDGVVESVKIETNLQQLINWREGQTLIVYKGCRPKCENRDDSFNYTHQHMHIYIYIYIIQEVGTAVAQWLRRCATNRKVAGSIPDFSST